MERSLFAFIWKHSKRDQMMLLAFTLFTFPFLYISLELPKRIINDAIGAETSIVSVFGYDISQTQFLIVLCFAFLLAVIVNGLLKMRLNTMKGVVAERLLRRFRYQLIARIMRFPRSYFQTTSQGELVSMVTSEAEPMGGLMGDAVAQPVFQAGQMATIVFFLFLQSPWFGLAGVALIPLQAWLIPKLQRQINLMNKERIKEVRLLASEIGETAAGATDLRTNGGWRFRLASFTTRLGKLFEIRFQIYQKKFFMKFLNNFINQLTPFFFYLVGGILAIRGDITVGALVAALAAYKDLSSPWKELLAYYNQTQDMSLRWEIVTDRFAPKGMVNAELFDTLPEDCPRLTGDISLKNVSYRTAAGAMLLEDLSIDIPKGSQVAILVPNQAERQALAEILTREVLPTRGSVSIGGHDLATLHQAVIAARIGYAQEDPYLFSGSLGDNLFMSLKTQPQPDAKRPKRRNRVASEAWRSGNSMDDASVDWIDPSLAELATKDDLHSWWFQLVTAIGVDEPMFRRMLMSYMDPDLHPELAQEIVALRHDVHEALKAKDLHTVVHRFDPDKINPTVPLGSNLLFASPRYDFSQLDLASERRFLAMITEHGLAEQGIAISQTVIDALHETFGLDGTNHPLFTALGIEEDLYEQLVDIVSRRQKRGDGAISDDEFALLLTVPFTLTAEQIGPSFPDSFKQEIVAIRHQSGESLRERAAELFIPITPDNYLPRLTVMENLLYGRVSSRAGLQADLVQDTVADVLRQNGLREKIATNLFDIPISIGGANLPTAMKERLAFNRAGIKKPDVLVLNHSLPSLGNASRAKIRNRLRELLPDTTQIFLDHKFSQPDTFDMFIEIQHGRLDGVETAPEYVASQDMSEDLRSKLKVIQANDMFKSLSLRSQRLLAFAAHWFETQPGTRIFSEGEPADSVYLCLTGLAELSYSGEDGEQHHISGVEPGRLIGDMAVILKEPRRLNLSTHEHTTFLRIEAEPFRSVIEDDKAILLDLLKTVSGHLNSAAEYLREIEGDARRNGFEASDWDGPK